MLSVHIERRFVAKKLKEYRRVSELHPGVLTAVCTEFVNALEQDLQAGRPTTVCRCIHIAWDTVGDSFEDFDHLARMDASPGCVQKGLPSAPPLSSD